VASFPALGPLLSEKVPTINLARLDQLLRGSLEPEDLEELQKVRAVLSWFHLDLHTDDAAFLARARPIVDGIRSDAIRAAVRDRLEIRTLVAALRRRHAGEQAPGPDTPWGYGRFVATIRANWSAPDFGVGRSFPWVLAARERLEAGDYKGLEQITLQAGWAAGERHLALHDFDFEAVVYYVMRWSMVDRWSRYDADAASQRFAELLEEALADFTEFENQA